MDQPLCNVYNLYYTMEENHYGNSGTGKTRS